MKLLQTIVVDRAWGVTIDDGRRHCVGKAPSFSRPVAATSASQDLERTARPVRISSVIRWLATKNHHRG